MKIYIFKAILILLIPLFLYSCQSAKDALQGKKRSKSADEFLVEKKNPLTMPPDFDKLPTPGQTEDEEIAVSNDTSDVKNLLNLKKESQNINKNDKTNNKSTEIENSVLQKIQ
tara:strand:+ start:31 stop:369 length:339 start_codon:yes stop_codon:yes gene_type:complete